MKILLVTGGAGFIGSNYIRHLLKNNKDVIVINYDKLTYAGNVNNLADVSQDPRYYFVKGDICDYEQINSTLQEYDPDYIINFAAESHVDRSINGPSVFGETNVLGTLNLLECVRGYWNQSDYQYKRFLQISTDEVYGSIDNDQDIFGEGSPLMPNNPYSASKAGADLMVRAFSRTYGIPVMVTRCCNNFGPFQYQEKFIPTCIINALQDNPIPLYGDGANVREWIHVSDHCEAITRVLFNGVPEEIYNIGSGEELSNIDLAKMILQILDKPQDAIVSVNDRLGHDRRYALDSSKTRNDLKWSARYKLREGMVETVKWYLDNRSWWRD